MGSFFYNLFITPIEYILEFVYVFLKRIIGNPGFVIIGVSLVVNFLILPIYMRADAIQEEENNKQKQMKGWQDRIHKNFSGDERFMIMQAYYREMEYRPSSAIKTLLPTILQVPFFIAAYHFLSNLHDLNGVAFGPIGDLSSPDALINIGGITVNVLPILMTLINLGAAVVYLRGYPVKSKIQTYLLAVLFLILLYGSPSGLVFYWTLNNIFSLCKNIVMKIFPNKETKDKNNVVRTEKWTFDMLFAQFLMVILMGGVIPAALISSSPSEFIVTGAPQNPTHYIFNVATIAAGYFLVWWSVFYYIAADKIRKMMRLLLYTISLISVIDYMFFGKNLGIISADLCFSTYPKFSLNEKVINIVIIAVIVCLTVILNYKTPRIVGKICGVLAVSLLILSVHDIVKINKDILDNPYLLESHIRGNDPIFRLSKKGKNVVILSMDAMIGMYVPYILAEKPELKSCYDGFTFYPNTLSFGDCTATGTPAMLGGYEYAPYYSDQRDDVSLYQKNREYTTIMPILFSGAGWEVTECDTPYAGYQVTPDMSEIDSIDGVKGIRTMGYYIDDEILKKGEDIRERNLFWYCIFKVVPLFAQTSVYDEGMYYSAYGISDLGGIYASHFMESYEVLNRLDKLTEITDDDVNTFLLINNDIAHDTKTLRLPEYEPSNMNSAGESDPGIRTDDDGNTFVLTADDAQPSYYHVNMAAFIQLGNWLEYLKEEGVYDNTRIIIVSDHGRHLNEFPDMGNPEIADLEWVNCIFMVKDFNSHGFSTSDEFMSNADTPAIAMEGIINNPINPYTGQRIDSKMKENGVVILYSDGFSLLPEDYTEYLFEDRKWIHVEENIFDANNWEIIEQ